MRNGALLLASALTVAIAAAHSILGERFILRRLLRRADLPMLFGSDVFTRRTIRFAWHLTTISWLGSAALFLTLAGSAQQGSRVLSATFFASALYVFAASRGRHLAWLVLGVIAIAGWLGST